MKPNCYECKWKRNIPGDCHISCSHPSEKVEDPYQQILSLLNVKQAHPLNNPVLNIKGNPHGISKGWFNFPFNFDPVWLENCDGFEKV